MDPVPDRLNLAQHCLGLGPAHPRDPDEVALVVVHAGVDPRADAERWTFRQLDLAVRSCARALSDSGFEPGERIVLRMGNTAEFPILWFGAMAAGLVAVPTSSQLTAEEAGWIAADSGAVAVAGDLPIDSPVPRIGSAQVREWALRGRPGRYAPTSAQDPAFLVYTSGTTAEPKGVLHAHRSVWGRRPMYAGWHDMRPGDVVLHAGALNWTYTLGVGLTDPWAVGATAVVYAGERDPGVWQRIVKAFGATVFAAVPGVYRQWLRAGVDAASLRSLRHALAAGEALSPTLRQEWVAATEVEIHEALGMSEISTFVSSGPTVPARAGSPGRAQPGRRIAVLPLDGGQTPCAPGTSGLLAVHRSDPGLMLGYWRRPDEDAATMRGDWFVTGDVVHLDGDGYMHHHGRNDDVITALGHRVSPLEVERVLEAHPAVADVAVAEAVVREGVSVVAAFVVPADPDAPEGLDPEPILAHARSHLAAYKCPRQITWVDSLPRTANGKVLRRSLAVRAALPE